MKAFLEVNVVPLTIRARTVFKSFEKVQGNWLYCFAAQQQNGTLTQQKLGFFTQNIMQNLMKLVFFLSKISNKK